MSKFIAPYLLRSEYLCKCCNQLPIDFFVAEDEVDVSLPYLMLFKYFQEIREAWGRAIDVSSGYRCPRHNEKVGGAPCSIHTFGLALDLECKDANEVDALAKVIRRVAPFVRMGKYKKAGSFIHIDVGYYIYPRIDKKWREGARWNG